MMKKHFFIIVLAAMSVSLILTDCSSKKVSATDSSAMQKKGNQGFTELTDLPCQSKDSNEDYIVVSGDGKSKDRTMAKDRAYMNAFSQLGIKLAGVTSDENMRVAVSTNVGYEDFHDKAVTVSKTIAKDVSVAGYRVPCEKFVIYDDGSFGCFVTLEYGKAKLVKQLYDGMSNEKLIRADYDFDKYMKKFEEDLRTYEKNNR